MRYFIEFAYKGTAYYGWQVQPNANTVQGELEKAFALLLKKSVVITGSSRTDTGVHAQDQFAHFDLETQLDDIEKFVFRLNGILPADISVKKIYPVLQTAHSRFDATHRVYQYRISQFKTPFFYEISYFHRFAFDLEKMNEASELLTKYIDFQCFSKVKTDVATFNCKIEYAFWEKQGDFLLFNIKADRFLRGMVRAIVGTLLDVGRGKLSINDFEEIILSKNRQKAGGAVPAQGLTLMQVGYPEEYFENQLKLLSIQNIENINDMNFQIFKATTDQELDSVRELFTEYQKFLGFSLCFQGFDEELAKLPYKYAEPDGTILLAKVGNEIAGVVALWKLEDGVCEMKRLYLKPQFQGLGIGRKLAEKIIEEAILKGYKKMKLDTVNRLETAISLYKSLGFEETKPYNFNPEDDVRYFEKVIA